MSVLPHKSVSWSAPLVTLSGVSSVFCFPVKTDKTQQHHLRLDPYPHSNRPHPNSPSPPSRLSSSRFEHSNAFAFLASDDDVSDDEDDDGDDVSDSSSSVSDNASVFPQLILPQVSSPFSDLDLPPPLVLPSACFTTRKVFQSQSLCLSLFLRRLRLPPQPSLRALLVCLLSFPLLL